MSFQAEVLSVFSPYPIMKRMNSVVLTAHQRTYRSISKTIQSSSHWVKRITNTHYYGDNRLTNSTNHIPISCLSMFTDNASLRFMQDIKHTNKISVAPYMVPRDDKKDKGGEDSYFISDDGMIMGVFDGVGGWSEVGVNPHDYSDALSKGCKIATENNIVNPHIILRYGYLYAMNVIGSSTACIISIDGNILRSTNLGDSGFRIVRQGKIALASIPQQHRFNMPYQLGTESSNTPEHADNLEFTLEEGDIIVLGTDGLFDNLYDENILNIIEQIETCSAEELAARIAMKAYDISKQDEVKTPFNDLAMKLYSLSQWDTGKQDDITVIAAKYKG